MNYAGFRGWLPLLLGWAWGLVATTTALAQGKVLIFLDTECPICQKTAPRVADLQRAYGGRVGFVAVYPTRAATEADVAAFQRDYGLSALPGHRDVRHRLVERFGVTTTPEVVFYDEKTGRVHYQGRLDNQFVALGKYRPVVTEFYLRDAIEAVLVGRPVAVAGVKPIGCLIERRKRR